MDSCGEKTGGRGSAARSRFACMATGRGGKPVAIGAGQSSGYTVNLSFRSSNIEGEKRRKT